MSSIRLEDAIKTNLPFTVKVPLLEEFTFDEILLENNHYAIPIKLYQDSTIYSLVPLEYTQIN